LKRTYGYDQPPSHRALHFRKLDYATAFGIQELTPEGIYDLAKRLAENPALRKDYLVRKMGMDPEIPEELEQAET
jgi:hypothetical protein